MTVAAGVVDRSVHYRSDSRSLSSGNLVDARYRLSSPHDESDCLQWPGSRGPCSPAYRYQIRGPWSVPRGQPVYTESLSGRGHGAQTVHVAVSCSRRRLHGRLRRRRRLTCPLGRYRKGSQPENASTHLIRYVNCVVTPESFDIVEHLSAGLQRTPCPLSARDTAQWASTGEQTSHETQGRSTRIRHYRIGGGRRVRAAAFTPSRMIVRYPMRIGSI
jgi:hypothetical protein